LLNPVFYARYPTTHWLSYASHQAPWYVADFAAKLDELVRYGLDFDDRIGAWALRRLIVWRDGNRIGHTRVDDRSASAVSALGAAGSLGEVWSMTLDSDTSVRGLLTTGMPLRPWMDDLNEARRRPTEEWPTPNTEATIAVGRLGLEDDVERLRCAADNERSACHLLWTRLTRVRAEAVRSQMERVVASSRQTGTVWHSLFDVAPLVALVAEYV